MYAFQIGDLERVMGIPVPFRKWLIERWNKQKERENKANNGEISDVNQPLSQQERVKMIKKAQHNQAVPPSPQSFMQSARNKK